MASMNFSTAKQFVRPPQRGIFPLDHDSECRPYMETYLACLKDSKEVHHKCKDMSRDYLQCRMDHQLMSQENLDQMGYGKEQEVRGAKEYDKAKEKAGFVAGKHIVKRNEWWFLKSKKDWNVESSPKDDKGASSS